MNSPRLFHFIAGLLNPAFTFNLPTKVKCAAIGMLIVAATGYAQPDLSIQSVPGDPNQVEVSWEKGDLYYALERAALLYPSIVWEDVQNVQVNGNEMTLVVTVSGQPLLYRLRLDQLGGAGVVMISDISPSSGSEMVNVTRETVVYFSEIVDPATVTTDSFYLIANGERIAGRVVVSTTERFATFFYDTALPPSTEVRVVVNGDLIIGRNDLNIDADGDGEEGGVLTADFRTLPLTRIAGTGIFGYVYDSLSELPIVGATIRVDAFSEANAVTDATGKFQLMDMPAPEFFVHVDGSTASAPSGFVYPNVGKPFHSTPGQNVHLNHHGHEFDIYLPPMAMADIQDLSPTEDIDVGFGDAGKETLATLFPEIDPAVWALMTVTFPAGSAQDEQGNAATTATIIPVPKDRLPAPLPATLDPTIVISIQAPGATNFDVPAPVTFPNTDGLLPGEKTLIWSFNHDAGEWQVIGTATVSADGLVAVSDPGVGILAPGWHFTNPGSQGRGGGGSGGGGNGDDPLQDDKDNCKKLQNLATSKAAQCQLGVLSGIAESSIPGFGCFASFAAGLAGYTADCSIDPNECTGSNAAMTTAVSAIGCVPVIGGAAAAAAACIQSASATSSANGCRNRLYGPDPNANFDSGINILSENISGIPNTQYNESTRNIVNATGIVAKGDSAESLLRDQIELIQAAGAVFSELMGSDVWIGVEDFSELPILYSIVRAMKAATELGSDEDEMISPLERIAIKALPFPSNFAANDVDIAINRFNSWTNKELTPEAFGILEIEIASQWAEVVISETGAEEWENISGGALEASILMSEIDDEIIETQNELLFRSNLLFAATDLSNQFEFRGELTNGEFDNFAFAPNRAYSVAYLDPRTLDTAITVFRTSNGRQSFEIPKASFTPSDIDTDGDGLSDDAEGVIGTSIIKSDTDDDGIDDFTEFTTDGLNPLDNRGFPTGIIASLPLMGEAKEVVVGNVPSHGLTAFLATGSHGLAIVDVDEFSNPIILGQLDLAGDCTDVAYDDLLDLAVVSSNAGGLHFVDVSDPMLPRWLRTINAESAQVEIANGIAYVASGGSLFSYDLFDPERFQSVLISSGTVAGLTRQGDMLYAMDSLNALHAIQVDNVWLSVIDVVQLNQGGGKVFAAGEILYAAATPSYVQGGYLTVDISDPANMALISESSASSLLLSPGRYLVDNGSGTGLLIGDISGIGGDLSALDLMLTSDPNDTGNFLNRISLPSSPYSVAIGSGIGFVADGEAGLVTVNYLGFDAGGIAPTVSMDLASLDLDGGTPGIQVLVGSHLSIPVEVADDVQVRNVELLLNGEVVGSDVSYPWELGFLVPNIEGDVSQLTIQVRAMDTGGNAGLSVEGVLEPAPDIFSPTLVFSVPEENEELGRTFNTLQIGFSESMDAGTLISDHFQLINTVGLGTPIALENSLLRSLDTVIQLQYPNLTAGDYQLILKASLIKDLSGNALGVEDRVIPFAILGSSATFVNKSGGSWQDANNWFEGLIPTSGDSVFLDLNPGATVVFDEPNPSPLFSYGDVKDLVGIVRKIVNSNNDPVSAYVKAALPDLARSQVESFDQFGGNPDPIDRYVVDALNTAIRSSDFYDETRFGNVSLRAETQQLIDDGERDRSVNRMLLEDTYPTELPINPIGGGTVISNLTGIGNLELKWGQLQIDGVVRLDGQIHVNGGSLIGARGLIDWREGAPKDREWC